MSSNKELLASLKQAFPQLFSKRDDDETQVLDLEKLRVIAGDGNYRDKYGLRWENKPEQFEADAVGKLPTLTHVGARSLRNDTAKPTHVLIEGDNYHALQVLAYTHARSVDVIYIDPPYNTGNKDFKYNDRFVDREDGYRHSKWLSFMAKRLRLAKTLLKDTGAIFLSIDENEFAQLKLLCDEVFGEDNFIAPVIWAAGRKNDSRFVSVSHEYVLCYAKNVATLKNAGVRWAERKEGLDEIYATAERLVREHRTDLQAASIGLKAWFKALPEGHASKAHSHYSWIDKRGVYFADNISWPGGGGQRYDVPHHETGLPCKVPSTGWRFSPESMRKLLAEDRVHFGQDHTTVPCRKSYLKDHETQTPYSVIYKDGRQATRELRELLGSNLFGYPKDTSVLKRLLSWAAGKDGVFLDFFAGSGSTAHAVMQLNAEDGGARQCILVTNDEGEFKGAAGNVMPGGICTNVTYPRLKKVIEGYTTPKGKDVPGLGENLEFFRTAFHAVPKSKGQTQAFAKACVPLLELRAGCYQVVEESDAWRLYTNGTKHLFVLLDDLAGEEALERLSLIQGAIDAYVFAYEPDDDTAELLSVLPNVAVQEVPKPILDLLQRLQERV